MSAEERRSAFMFALGMGYYAWHLDHQPILPVVVMVVGITLGTWLGSWALGWLWRLVSRFPYRIVRRAA